MTVQDILKGNRRALARFLTKVENHRDQIQAELSELFPYSSNAHIIGITGAPGTGKSSLVTTLTKILRGQDLTVAIVAVDPTSPFSGGAILGDRIRMRDLSGDKGVYIRSMATRGNLGGLASTTQDIVRVIASAGYDVIIVETVGAGQSEVDIVRMAHTTLVIEAPNLGDDVQAIKAGILEIADILVVNKCDLVGADRTVSALKGMLELGHPTKNMTDEAELWMPPIVRTSTKDNIGMTELTEQIHAHREYISQSNLRETLRQQYLKDEFNGRLQVSLFKRLIDTIDEDMITGIIRRIAQYEIDPQQGVDELLKDMDFSRRPK